ncbi:hypothetical protein JR316_0000424 [Psilocybe cubensis]|uniref:Uncharacterized protein n=2 Tax=Psilocybe cubensis TaxID=181762 RepID=A0ACB8HF67_PSICU|nr:hypothetical protein JR316_0000424 [Psilocybe cubensis]KAH9486360.1 hypothetical protein JR316_0000424 [Psilocybe cubensis]
MFGGYDLEADKPSARVIIINPSATEWWYEEHLDIGGPTPCISPSLVTVGNKIYIFGGYQSYNVDPMPCYSYSVLEWEPSSATSRSLWSWKCCNNPYKQPMPEKTIIGEALSVYNGKFILLAPGKTNEHDKNNKYLRFTNQNLFYFRPSDETFRPLFLQGDTPKDIGWYVICDLQSTMATVTAGNLPPFINLNVSATVGSVPKKRGRPPRNLPSSSSPSPSVAFAPPSHPRTPFFPPIPSIVICAWIAQRETPHGYIDLERTDPVVVNYKPEIWRITFGPMDECENLDYMQKVSQMDADFQGFTVANGRMYLLGSDQKIKSSFPDSKRLDTWNIFLDLTTIS